VSAGTLSPQFAPDKAVYALSVLGLIDSLVLTPTAAAAAAATITVNGVAVASGAESAPIPLTADGATAITVRVVAPAGAAMTYNLVVVRGEASSLYFKASNADPGDRFGRSIAIDGDTLVVGAPWEDASVVNGGSTESVPSGVRFDPSTDTNNMAPDAGAVYVFTRTGGVWRQQAYLKASNAEAGDNFGHSVALSGDTLVVGAPFEDSGATGVNGDQANNAAFSSGAAYVFTRTGGVWNQRAYLKASNTGSGDQLGYSVALSGDTLVVGAPFEDSGATGVNGDQANNAADAGGAAYVYTRTGDVWNQQAYLKASNTESDDRFGYSVAVSGNTVAVGAFREGSNATGVDGDPSNNDAPSSGAVYVFERTATIWRHQAYLKASNAGEGDWFGIRLTLSGDTLAVGAPLEDSADVGVNGIQHDESAPDSGAVYVFTRSGETWTQQAYLKASNTGLDGWFGIGVALADDILLIGGSGDRSRSIGVNGDQASNAAFSSGAAYMFVRMGTSWSQRAYVKASNTGDYDRFGFAVAVSRDVAAVGAPEEDGSSRGLVGADQADNKAPYSGAVYVWSTKQEP